MAVVNCSGITKGGQKCRARVIPGTNWCVFHSADAAQRRAWAAQGGANSSAQARAKKALPCAILTSDELISWLSLVFKQTIVGRTAPGVATASAAVAKTIVEISKAALLEERLTEIERALGIAERSAS